VYDSRYLLVFSVSTCTLISLREGYFFFSFSLRLHQAFFFSLLVLCKLILRCSG